MHLRHSRPSRLMAPLLAVLVAACASGASPSPEAGAASPSGAGASATASSPRPGGTATADAAASASASASGTPTAKTPPADSGSPTTPAGGGELALEDVASDLKAPLFLNHAGDGSGIRYVVLQGGQIVQLDDAGAPRTPAFLDISDRLQAGGEQGLLGLAFHPKFKTDRRFFVNYTNRDGDTVISAFRAVDAGNGDPASEEVLLTIDQPFANHNGGGIAFGPDGFLYIATGDGGGGGDPEGNGQRTDALLGKILRIDIDGQKPYAIPQGNAFPNGGDDKRPEIWALGMRNPFRFSFDRETGDIYIGDVGQGTLEEIDFAPAGAPGGINYGWNIREGTRCFRDDESGCDRTDLTDPIAEYGREGGCTVIGGYVYRGAAHPSMQGRYLFADFCEGTIMGLDASAAASGKAPHETLMETGGQISSFGEDEAGELYVTDLGAGTVKRIVLRDG